MIYRFPGGKNKKSVVNKILSKAPLFYNEARFPFVGGGGIFWNIETNVKRWINDIDENLMSVYFALRDRPQEFIENCRKILPAQKNEELTSAKEGGRKIYNARLKKVFDDFVAHPEMNAALRYYFINRTVFGGRVNYDMPSRLYYSNPAGWNIIKTDKLERAAKILENTQITCDDYSVLLNEPGNDVWEYLDPPYYKNSKLNKGSKLYRYNFTKENHIELAENVKKCQHQVLLSYDDDKDGFIRSLYSDKMFHIYTENWTYCGTTLKEKEVGKELIITNYRR